MNSQENLHRFTSRLFIADLAQQQFDRSFPTQQIYDQTLGLLGFLRWETLYE